MMITTETKIAMKTFWINLEKLNTKHKIAGQITSMTARLYAKAGTKQVKACLSIANCPLLASSSLL